MSDQRPNPDQLLARVKADQAKEARGKLKIFFGAAPGVGKTYAMLEAGRKLGKAGIDVVVGYIEPHTRPDTLALVLGLEVLPRRQVHYRGATLQEFDPQAAIERKPQVLLVDELAHTNAYEPDAAAASASPTPVAHVKRWQDVEAVRDAGIDVYTTLNVQHLESLNDVVEQITGIVVRETVPDSIFESADEVELVDLPPDDLIERLRDGKVYVPERARLAVHHFFRKGNLIALRELALRRTAERVNAQMRDYRQAHAIVGTWPTADRIMVCVGPSPFSARLVRAARRMAASLQAPWTAVTVAPTNRRPLSDADRNRLSENLHLAEQLGAKTATLEGTNAVEEILRYAHEENTTKIIVGKPLGSRWREFLLGSFVHELTRKCGDIDVYVISGDTESAAREKTRAAGAARGASRAWRDYALAAAIVAGCTVIGWLMAPHFALVNLVMVYLLGVVGVSARLGRGPSALASVLAVAAFDYFFVPPFFTFAVSDTEYLVTFFIMLTTGLTISTLTAQVRAQAESARRRERRTAALYELSRELASARTREEIARRTLAHVASAIDCQPVLLLAGDGGQLEAHGEAKRIAALSEHDRSVARWVFDHGKPAGLGTDTLVGAKILFLPMATADGPVGVLAARPENPERNFEPDQVRHLESLANQAALALLRANLSAEAEHALLQAETERLRNALLSSVSHDLRTPLAAITGASSTLLDLERNLAPEARRELVESIHEEAYRLNRLVGNLLDMTRLSAGAIVAHKEWQPVDEVVGVALARLARQATRHPIETRLPPDLPPVPLDGLLIEQVLLNLLENAIKYTPAGTPITLSAWRERDAVVVEVADRGPGLPAGEERRVFEKFYQARRGDPRGGVGLGLTICRGIVEIHGGRIWAENRPEGGVAFRFSLPLEGKPPPIADASAHINGAAPSELTKKDIQ